MNISRFLGLPDYGPRAIVRLFRMATKREFFTRPLRSTECAKLSWRRKTSSARFSINH